MNNLTLPPNIYTWSNALFWGNCKNHLKQAAKGPWTYRVIHMFIAAVEFIPIIGQITSVAEKILFSGIRPSIAPSAPLQNQVLRIKNSPLPANISPTTNPPLTANQKIAREIFNERTELYRRGRNYRTQSNPLFGIAKAVQYYCSSKGKTFGELIKDPLARAVLEESSTLKNVIAYYQEMKLIYYAQELFDNREQMWQEAAKKFPSNPEGAFTFVIRVVCDKNGISFSDLLKNKNCRDILFQSPKFQKAFKIYIAMKTAEAETEAQRNAKRLAKEHAEGEGLVTQLGLNDKVNDKKELVKALRAIQLQVHPDKQEKRKAAGLPPLDEELIRKANALRDMIDKGEFEEYRKELKSRREKFR